MLVEVQHAFLPARFYGRAQFFEAVFLDQFADCPGVDHDFLGGRHAAGDGRDHALADHRLQRAGNLAADLIAFVRL